MNGFDDLGDLSRYCFSSDEVLVKKFVCNLILLPFDALAPHDVPNEIQTVIKNVQQHITRINEISVL